MLRFRREILRSGREMEGKVEGEGRVGEAEIVGRRKEERKGGEGKGRKEE